MREWKTLQGSGAEVIFPLSCEPGDIAFYDFTQLMVVEVTIGEKAYPHLLFHYRLVRSGWTYVRVVEGGRGRAH